MVDQATMKNGTESVAGNSPPRSAARSMAELLHDAVSLTELQARLIAADSKRALAAIAAAAGLIIVGCILAVCSIPVALIGIAFLIQYLAHTSLLAAFWWTFLIGVVVSMLLVGGGVAWLKKGPPFFKASREELAANLQWFKDMLRRTSRGTKSERF